MKKTLFLLLLFSSFEVFTQNIPQGYECLNIGSMYAEKTDANLTAEAKKCERQLDCNHGFFFVCSLGGGRCPMDSEASQRCNNKVTKCLIQNNILVEVGYDACQPRRRK